MARIRSISTLALLLTAAAAPAADAQLSTADPQFWHQTSAGIDLPAQGDALFGSALAAGDFDANGFDDLVIGIPEYDLADGFDVGLVLVMYGSESGPTTVAHDLWTQDNVLLTDEGEEDDVFGRAFAVGDFDGAGRIDLAIGACRRTVAGVNDAGAIDVDYGDVRPGGLIAQESIAGESSDPSDFFGQNLAAGDFDADGVDELAVGVEWKAVDGDAAAGVVHVLRGVGGSGLSPLEVTTIQQSMSPSEPGDHFGAALVAGRFAGHSGADLAIGASLETFAGNVGAGAVHVHFSDALFVDGFEVDGLARWSAVAGAF